MNWQTPLKKAKLLFLIYLGIIGLLLSSCATITDRHQFVRVVPPNSQTEIHYDNQKVSDGRPITLKMTRESRPKIIFKEKNDTLEKKLKTSYRWGQSFGGNALLYVYAPIGWALDWITGAAWEAQELIDSSRNFPLNFRSKLFILPPTGVESLDSQKMGRELTQWFYKKYPQVETIPYKKSYYKALSFGLDHESVFDSKDPNFGSFAEVFHDTGATHLAFSHFDRKTNELKVEVFSPYSEKVVSSNRISNIEPDENKNFWTWVGSEIFEILPNTVSIGSVNTNVYGCASNVTTLDRYCAKSRQGSSLDFLSALNFTNVLHFRKRETWGLYLRFFPDFNLAFKQVEFVKSNPTLNDLNLDWAYITFGYGPRLSFILPMGELFFETTPFLGANYLRLHSHNYDSTQYIGKIGLSIQIGINSWLSNKWNLRLYVKGDNQNILENHSLEKIDPGTGFKSGLGILQTGLSIGYYFSSEKAYIMDQYSSP